MNERLKMARVGVLLDEQACYKRWALGLNVFERFVTELLMHAGVPHDTYHNTSEAVVAAPDILIVAVANSDRGTTDQLLAYAEQGGTLIAYGGLNALAVKLGYMRAGDVGKGYVSLPDGLYTADRPLRFLSAEPWIAQLGAAAAASPPAAAAPLPATPSLPAAAPLPAAIGELHRERPDGEPSGPALQRFAIGRGRLERWSVAALQTIVGLQQGSRPVLEDGVPAPDGTAAVNDGVLKADDVAEMDWKWDRCVTEAGEPYFAHPYADLWKEVLVSHLLQTALSLNLTLPFIDYWPNGVSQVALLSLDSDHTQDEEARTTLDLLQECGIPATWCMMAPWYSKAMYEQITQNGHELALHYNAVPVDQGTWSEEAFHDQAEAMKASAQLDRIISNKNHLTRIEGWGELFRWCEDNGIASEQSRGNSKKGSVGFLYGTAHPYFPIAWTDEHNRIYDVLQIGFHYGDFLQCDPSIIRSLLEQVVRVHGTAHFVFHQIHIHRKEPIRAFLREYVSTAKKMGFTFWTGERINEWQRARRSIRVTGLNEQGATISTVAVQLEKPEDVVVWIPCSPAEVQQVHTEHIFGVACRKQLITNRK